MNEIPELKADLAFLKKLDSRSKVWREFEEKTGKIRSNFLLHPKRLSSDSDEFSDENTPRKYLSAGVIKNLEENNNIPTRVHHTLSQTARINEPEKCYIESEIGDGADNKKSTTKTVTMTTSKKIRPSTSIIDAFDRKFKNLVERSLKILTNIREMINQGIPQPDGEEDIARRTKRLQEFSSRFSRIYLYPLLRQTDELSLPEKMSISAINQKFLYAQQIVLQGLQAYLTHLPSSIGKCGTEKLRSLLDQILYLCQLYDLVRKDLNSENCEFMNALRSHVELLLEAVNNFEIKFEEKKPKDKQIVKKKPNPQGAKPPTKNKPKLSMYLVSASFRKDAAYRRAMDTFARKKFAVKSRYKTAGFKHRPPIEKNIEVGCQSTFKFTDQRFHSKRFDDTPRKTPFREDDIKTMVEGVSDVMEVPPNSGEEMVNHENSTASSCRPQLVQDTDHKIEDGNVEKALEVLRKFFDNSPENKQTDFLEKIANEVDKRKEEFKGDKSKKKMKDPVVTVTGAKNAKLICIRDDNSATEDDDPSRKDKEIMTIPEIKFTSSEAQTDMKKGKKKSVIKISRLPKTNRRLLNVLPKDYAINIIQYKLRYNHFNKHNPMYRKSTHIQPWVLMGQISDDLLHDILQSVTGEMEVNEVLENLYNSEFQY